MLKNRYQIARLPNRQSIYSLETDINVNNVNYTSHGCKDKETLKENKTENIENIVLLAVQISSNNYTIGLLWTDSNVTLPNNWSLAVSQFLLLDNKLNKKTELKTHYTDTIHDYINKGHATKLTPANAKFTSKIANYIHIMLYLRLTNQAFNRCSVR